MVFVGEIKNSVSRAVFALLGVVFLSCVLSTFWVETVLGDESKAIPDANFPNWVKLCQNISVKGAEAKSKIEQMCLLAQHEQLDGVTGFILVSTAIRHYSMDDKKFLTVTVPLGMALPSGVVLQFDNEKRPMRVAFSACHYFGCMAETIATDEIIKKFKAGHTLHVYVDNSEGNSVLFTVPLQGFSKAYSGAPIDMKAYKNQRRKLIRYIRDRSQRQNSGKLSSFQSRDQQMGNKKRSPMVHEVKALQ